MYPNGFYLVDNATGACLLPGATLTDFRGNDHVFVSLREDGRRINVEGTDTRQSGSYRSFFPTVFPGVRVVPQDA